MKTKSILFVDDDPDIGSLMKALVARAGYFPVIATSGPDALKILEKRWFDLIVTDYQMPGMNGLAFLAQVRSDSLSNAPALMMSGFTDTAVRRSCYNLGVYDFISKPEDPEIILKRIENGLAIAELLRYRSMMETELIGARKLQDNLFPESESSHSTDIRRRVFALPLIEIGGDCWDFFGDDHRTWFYLADVTGHGLSAALFTSALRLVFRRAAANRSDPGELVCAVNREMAGFLGDRVYVSAFCGMIDGRENSLSYTNAGHPAATVSLSGKIRVLRSSGMWIGVDAEFPYQTKKVVFQPGDWLYICTDGILEGSSMRDGKSGRRVVFEEIRSDIVTMQTGFDRIQEFVKNDLIQQDDCTQLLIWRENSWNA